MKPSKHVRRTRGLLVIVSLGVALCLTPGGAGLAAQDESVQHYKMFSALEYSGRGQFKNQSETLFTVRKQHLPDDNARYELFANGRDTVGANPSSAQPSLFKELSFVIDGKTQRLSGTGKDLAFLEKVTNQCVKALKEVTKNNAGRTWKQGFDLSSLGNSPVCEIKFTLTAMPVETEVAGKLIAVRALSEPFFVKIAKDKGGAGPVQCRINCAYVFDSEFEDVYVSVSVFKAATNVNGFNEMLQHTVTTSMVDAGGRPAEFIGELGDDKDFKKLVSKLGVISSLEVTKGAPLPQWARAEGVRAAQVANICGAVSCEGSLNPVATIYLPVASTVGLQSLDSSEGGRGEVEAVVAEAEARLGGLPLQTLAGIYRLLVGAPG